MRPLSNTKCRKPDISAARHHPTYRECLQATLHRRSCEASMAHGQALERFRGRRRHISTENCKQSMSRIDLGPFRVVTNQAEDFISWGMQKTSNKNTFCCLFNGSFPCKGKALRFFAPVCCKQNLCSPPPERWHPAPASSPCGRDHNSANKPVFCARTVKLCVPSKWKSSVSMHC